MKKQAVCLLLCILYVLAFFAQPTASLAVKSDDGRALAGEVLAEGAVLLQNRNHALPLSKGETLALFGNAQIDYLCGGGGSSVMFTDRTVTPVQGLKAAEKQGKLSLYKPLLEAYEAHVGECSELKALWGVDAFYQNYVKESIEMQVSDSLWESSAKAADTAVFFLSRFASEGYDMKAEPGGYYLTEAEEEILKQMTERFRKTVVILNIPSAIDLSLFAGDSAVYDVDAVLSVWYPGEEAGNVIASILLGEINPSGKLTATFAKSHEDYYSSKTWDNRSVIFYEEDIFVGYRQFSTFHPDRVLFGFGFGLSYTSFGLNHYRAEEKDGVITVYADVVNTGKRAGKEVMQVYYSAPCGVLGNPAAELAGYVKTPLLKPGESAEVTVSFRVDDMAAYDDTGKLQKSAYILEQGDYRIYLGNSLADATSRDPIYTYEQKEMQVTAQYTERAASTRLTQRLLADGSYEALEKRKAERNEQEIAGYENNASAPDHVITLADLYRDRSLTGAFLAQLSVEQMAALAGGQNGTSVTYMAGSFVGNILNEYGGHDIAMTDGCHGVRVRSLATYFPSGTCLASTFNDTLAERMGETVGLECLQSGIDIWLGPGVNIIRNPLCGRNFEYYSEDPLLTGKMAAAVTRGVQSCHVAVALKHYTANNKEENRGPCDSQVSERALREIYLKGFEICIKEANPWAIMSSCGTVNGTGVAGNYDLMTAIPVGEWGWDGVFLSDWANMDGEVDELKAGHHLSMPQANPQNLVKAVERGTITRAQLEENTRRLLNLILNLHTVLREVDPDYRGAVQTLKQEGTTSIRLASYAAGSGGYHTPVNDENGFLTGCYLGQEFIYYVEAAQSGDYDVRLFTGMDMNGTVTVSADDAEIGTVSLMSMTEADGGQRVSEAFRVLLGTGVHKITVRVTGGSVSLSRITFEPVGGGFPLFAVLAAGIILLLCIVGRIRRGAEKRRLLKTNG